MAAPRMASIKSVDEFRGYCESLGIALALDDQIEQGPAAPLAQPLRIETANGPITLGNRFSILPMEGWDGTLDGRPSDLTRRRWRNFGLSGAKLIWGGEAIAVRDDARDNPRQLLINRDTVDDLASLRTTLVDAHLERFGPGADSDLFVGLQLIHSGRYSRRVAASQARPTVAYRHPYLDPKVGITSDDSVLSDADLGQLVNDFVEAARLAWEAGFRFVDVKHCHGYLGHEILSGYDRPGRYGGSLNNRARFLGEVVEGIKATTPAMEVGVRLSVFDFMPFVSGSDGVGQPGVDAPYRYAFGGDGTGLGIDLVEVSALLNMFRSLGIRLVCTTAGSPYYNPHIVRPAAFPPSDGYLPPEDPLVGVARQVEVTAELKANHPELIFVGSGYSYLQEWLPHVAQRAVRDGKVDVVGLGRMVLSYPELPADLLAGRPMARKRICRTFSDCTTAARNGIVSGCYPLDPSYKTAPERDQIQKIRQAFAAKLAALPARANGTLPP